MDKFIEKFAEAVEVEDLSTLKAETEFRNLEEWNSMAVLSVIEMLDTEYGKEIGINDIRSAITIGDLFNMTK